MPGGGTPAPESSGKKKSVDFQLNMIPFIDLLSVLISFLLMTAVWTQVAGIDVEQEPNQTDPVQQKSEDDDRIAVMIKKFGYAVELKEGWQEIPLNKGAYDAAALDKLITSITAENRGQQVMITSEDSVPYQELIAVMDLCLTHGLEKIQVGGVD